MKKIQSKAQYDFLLKIAKGERTANGLDPATALEMIQNVNFDDLPDRVEESGPPRIREAKTNKVI